MPSTNFLRFNEANDAATTYNDSEYTAATQRQTGVVPGMALSRMHNKMFYQWSGMVKAIADYIVAMGYDARDDDISGITAALKSIAAEGSANLGYLLRKNSTAYAVGDIAFSPQLPSWAYLECTQAGTTAGTEFVFGGGKSVTDGTVVWRIKDSRCPYSLGQFVCKLGEPKPYEYLLLCDGSNIIADDYPELCEVLGGTQLPNLIGRVLQGDSVGGIYKAAGLPNITGNTETMYRSGDGSRSTMGTGAIRSTFYSWYPWDNSGGNSLSYRRNSIDASLSNAIYGASTTVQPPAYTTRVYICYAG